VAVVGWEVANVLPGAICETEVMLKLKLIDSVRFLEFAVS